MIKPLTKYDFPNQTPVWHGYDESSVPSLSLDNFQVLIDKVNEVVKVINSNLPSADLELLNDEE